MAIGVSSVKILAGDNIAVDSSKGTSSNPVFLISATGGGGSSGVNSVSITAGDGIAVASTGTATNPAFTITATGGSTPSSNSVALSYDVNNLTLDVVKQAIAYSAISSIPTVAVATPPTAADSNYITLIGNVGFTKNQKLTVALSADFVNTKAFAAANKGATISIAQATLRLQTTAGKLITQDFTDGWNTVVATATGISRADFINSTVITTTDDINAVILELNLFNVSQTTTFNLGLVNAISVTVTQQS